MPIGNSRYVRTTPDGSNYSSVQPYTEDYKEKIFFEWYNHGCPRGNAILTAISPDELGRKPTLIKVLEWIRELGWRQRAEEMDKEAKKFAVRRSIENRAKMFLRAAEVGEEMTEMGIAYLKEHGIDSANSAIKAIIEGHKMEKSSLGGAEFLTEIATMSDEDLKARMMTLLSKSEYLQSSNAGEVVDADFSEE